MANTEKLIAEEKAKRKELSRVRVFWLLIVGILLLIVNIVVQVALLRQ